MFLHVLRFIEIHRVHFVALLLTMFIAAENEFTFIGLLYILLLFGTILLRNRSTCLLPIILFPPLIFVSIMRILWTRTDLRRSIINGLCQKLNYTQVSVNNSNADCLLYFFNGKSNITSSQLITWIGLRANLNDFPIITPPILMLITILMVAATEGYLRRYRRILSKKVFNSSVISYSKPSNSILFPISTITLKSEALEFFPSLATYTSYDSSVKNCFKYTVNFFFYRFGIETIISSFLALSAFRLDCISMIYILISFLLSVLSRKCTSRTWSMLRLVIMAMVLMEYIYCLGMPGLNLRVKGLVNSKLVYILSKVFVIDLRSVVGDCVLLLMLAMQTDVFRMERKFEIIISGGYNYQTSANQKLDQQSFDFTESIRNFIDVLKRIIYYHGIIISVLLLYLAATSNVNLFCLIYLFTSFGLLYEGNDLLVKSEKIVFRMWNTFISVCFLIMFLRIALHISSCFTETCLLVQLFGSRCDSRYVKKDKCSNFRTHGLTTDCVCLTFLIFLRKAFKSRSFKHLRTDMIITAKLTAEGARIFSQILIDKLKQNTRDEERKMQSIANSIERIKNEQRELLNRMETPITHYRAIRSWNRAMFQSTSDILTRINNQNGEHDEDFEDYYSINNDKSENDYRRVFDSLSSTAKSRVRQRNSFCKLFTKCGSAILYVFDIAIYQLKKRAMMMRSIDEKLSTKKHNMKISEGTICNGRTKIEFGKVKKKPIEELFNSVYLFLAANSDGVCYSLMIFCQATSGTLFSLILSLLALLWGMLCIPRPPSVYWMIMIGYTELMIILKYILIFIRNNLDKKNWMLNEGLKPLSIASVLGLKPSVNVTGNRIWESFNFLDILLLIALSFHKNMLKNLNLWNSRFGGDRASFIEEHSAATYKKYSYHTKMRKILARVFNSTDDRLPVHDYYTKMFYADLTTMVIVVIFYSSFGETSHGDVMTSLKENKVPIAFLLLLLVQFIFIIFDRVIYLKKNVKLKLLFHIFQVLVVHMWLFFLLPWLKNKYSTVNKPAMFWYIVKCIYFTFSAKQIKCGYPIATVGSIYSRSYNYINLYLFKFMMLIPFMFEIRSLMSWLTTDTCLSLTHWLYFDDIYASVFKLKCLREVENKYPTARGQRYNLLYKIFIGGLAILILLVVMWSPLLLFSLSPALFESNPPSKVEVHLRLGPYPPVFSAYLDHQYLSRLTGEQYDKIKHAYSNSEDAKRFLRDFEITDISFVRIPIRSSHLWSISPAALEELKVDSLSGKIYHEFECLIWSKKMKKDSDSSTPRWETFRMDRSVKIDSRTDCVKLSKVLSLNNTESKIMLKNVYPRFMHVKGKENVVEVQALKRESFLPYYGNLSYGIKQKGRYLYWVVDEDFEFIIFADKVSPESISFLTKYGIFGIYTTFVLVVGRLIRTMSQASTKIMFQELPNVDRLLQLIFDIYTVRHKKMFEYEELLFSKLLFLYRSPEALIDFTQELER